MPTNTSFRKPFSAVSSFRHWKRPSLPAVVAPSALFKAKDTDLATWLAKTEEFAEKHFGVKINLRKRFAIPEVFPWKSVIPVFDPGGLTNRDAVQKALKDSGLTVWEEVDVMKYSGSEVTKNRHFTSFRIPFGRTKTRWKCRRTSSSRQAKIGWACGATLWRLECITCSHWPVSGSGDFHLVSE